MAPSLLNPFGQRIEQRLLAWSMLVFALIFAGNAIYVFGAGFVSWVDSDASVSVLLAQRTLAAQRPVVADWYYANGDIWLFAPHLFGLLPVAVWGISETALRTTVILGFLIEVTALGLVYRRLQVQRDARAISWLAAAATLMSWSALHVAFAYAQLAYGFLTTLYVLVFVVVAYFMLAPQVGRLLPCGVAAAVVVVSLQNPTRALAFVVLPIVVGLSWPWRSIAWRRRAWVGGTVVFAWGIAFVVYRLVLLRYVLLAYPAGHAKFDFVNIAGIKRNLSLIWRGCLLLCGQSSLSIAALPGLLLVIGALALVCYEVLGSRTPTTLRVVCALFVIQAGVVLLPLMLGSLMTDPSAIRYIMPSLLAMVGLAVLVAANALATRNGFGRRVSFGWLLTLPLAAVVGIGHIRAPQPSANTWPDSESHRLVAAKLHQLKLSHGFSSVVNANIQVFWSKGLRVCPVYFAHRLLPQRWLADARCYDESAIPDRFFVLADKTLEAERAREATLPAPLEKYDIGPYTLTIHQHVRGDMDWLDFPLRDGAEMHFPFSLRATHLAFSRDKVERQGNVMVATGAEGYVVFGPYITLPKGRYVAHWYGSALPSTGELIFIAAADVGKFEIMRKTRAGANLTSPFAPLMTLSFKIDRAWEHVEFPVYSRGGARVVLREFVLERR